MGHKTGIAILRAPIAPFRQWSEIGVDRSGPLYRVGVDLQSGEGQRNAGRTQMSLDVPCQTISPAQKKNTGVGSSLAGSMDLRTTRESTHRSTNSTSTARCC